MATKEELSERLNTILDTDYDWDRMYKEDMEHLLSEAESGKLAEKQIKHMVKEHGKDYVESQIDSWYPGKFAKLVM